MGTASAPGAAKMSSARTQHQAGADDDAGMRKNAGRQNSIRIRLPPAVRQELREQARARRVVEASIVRLGVALVLNELRQDCRPEHERLGFPQHLLEKVPRLRGARSAPGASLAVSPEGRPLLGKRR